MTPITLSKSSTLSQTLPDQSTELATQPLTFTAERYCTNKAVMAAVLDALSDRSSSDQLIATILKNAHASRYQVELNQIIRNLQALHGPDIFVINTNIVRLLADQGLELMQNKDGTVELGTQVIGIQDQVRHQAIRLATENNLPGELTRVVCAYADDIEVAECNFSEIITILTSRDAHAKSLLIAAASRQGKINYLNELFSSLYFYGLNLDLSYVDLSNLDLSGINLEKVNVCYANLQNTILIKAHLHGTKFCHSNLNQAYLHGAQLSRADLSYARLVGASLAFASLNEVRFQDTCLLGAYLHCARLFSLHDLAGAECHFADMQSVETARLRCMNMQPDPELESPVTALIIPSDTRPELRAELAREKRAHGIIVIDEAEKNILLDHRVAITDNDDGTVQLSRAVTIHHDQGRHHVIDTSLSQVLPTTLRNLIAAYDEEIEISVANRVAIINIFKSSDQEAKSLLIGTASRQGKIKFLNDWFLNNGVRPDLSYVDLSNLDLTGIDLSNLNLTGANFQNSTLKSAVLTGTKLLSADLNGADLSMADLRAANLTMARMVGTNLKCASLAQAILNDACLLGANLASVDLNAVVSCWGLTVQFSNLSHANPGFEKWLFLLNLEMNSVDARVIPGAHVLAQSRNVDESITDPEKTLRPGTITITDHEKNILLANGVTLQDNGDGTVRLSKAPRMFMNAHRHQIVDTTLQQSLPTVLTTLINEYEDEIEISPNNEFVLLNILKSTDQQAKARIIAAASHQSQIGYLNELFEHVKQQKGFLNLSHLDLSNLNLRGINLSKANLTRANMHGCDLLMANLRETLMINANLNGALLNQIDLSYANLTHAKLIGAKLTNTKMERTTLYGAVLKFANLTGAGLDGADLSNAWLDHAILASSDLRLTDLSSASLVHTKMYCADLHRTNLTNAKLNYADLTGTRIWAANLTNADFSHASLHDISIKASPKLSGAVWTGTSFRQIESDQDTLGHMPIRMWMHSSSKK